MTIDDVLSLIETQQEYNEWMAQRYAEKDNRLAEASYSGAVAGLSRLKDAIKELRNQDDADPRYEPSAKPTESLKPPPPPPPPPKNYKPSEVWNGWVPLEEYELLREAALQIARAFAAKNPKWFSMAMGCEQDPSGAHAFLERYKSEAWR